MSLFNQGEKAYLLLANGKVFEGRSCGAKGTVIGEVVFTTGLTAYQETLTDPSYYGQIVTQTFPLIGNYGVNEADAESNDTYLSGYIIREWCNTPSNFRCEGNINDFLIRHNVIGIHNIDTRCLTRMIRETGVMNGMITTEDVYANKEAYLEQIRAFSIKDAVKAVTDTQIRVYGDEDAPLRVVLFDFGYKRNIRRMLIERGCQVYVVPATTTAEQIREIDPDGIMLSNGPGDPKECVSIIKEIKKLYDSNVPIFAICLGHQLMALANGGKTYKLKYGHRGGNHPVKDLQTGRVYISSQNHGYAVDADSIPESVAVPAFVNVNDNTNEGMSYVGKNIFTVQFHPEACPGPQDSGYLFDRFMDMMGGTK